MPFERPGRYAILVVTKLTAGRLRGRFVAAGARVTVVATAHDRIPRRGERPPPISTDTIESAGR